MKDSAKRLVREVYAGRSEAFVVGADGVQNWTPLLRPKVRRDGSISGDVSLAGQVGRLAFHPLHVVFRVAEPKSAASK